MEEAPGVPLTSLDDCEAEFQAVLHGLGAYVAKVHQFEIGGFGLVGFAFRERQPPSAGNDLVLRGVLNSWWKYLALNRDQHVATCRQIGAIEEQEAEQILGLFATCDSLCSDVPSCWLHGDLGSHNIFTNGKEITALIDWEDTVAGDPVFDIALWATFQPERRHSTFLEGYRSVRSLPDDFEIRFWLYFLRIAISKTVHRYRFNYTDLPGRPSSGARIRRGLDGALAAQRQSGR